MCVHVPIKESMNSFDLNLELRSSNEIEGVSCICCPPTGVPGAPPIVSTWKQLNYLDMLQRHEKLHVIYLTKIQLTTACGTSVLLLEHSLAKSEAISILMDRIQCWLTVR